MPTKVETWKDRGLFTVTRDDKGRFIRWEKYVVPVTYYPRYEKAVAMYGYSVTREGGASRRFEFYGGTGSDLYACIVYASRHPPIGRFQTVSVSDFLTNPGKYSTGGYWVNKEVES